MHQAQIYFLMGPTASGKTDIALELVKQQPFEIISVDSAMIYRGMDIGTAKPTPDILTAVPHHLIDICDPAEAYSAARFRDDALQKIREILGRGKIPLLVGGTMLYFRVLEGGLSELPSADEAVRARLETEASEKGWAALHARLASIDPVTAQRIHPNDPQRIQRALEVYELKGKTMTELFDSCDSEPLPYQVIKLVVSPAERSVLHRRIEERFGQMLEQGFLQEVERLYQRGDLHPSLPSIRAVGYRQLWEHIEGKMTFQEAVNRAIIVTRQLAKRQMTWLRPENDENWFDALDKNVMNKMLKYINNGPI